MRSTLLQIIIVFFALSYLNAQQIDKSKKVNKRSAVQLLNFEQNADLKRVDFAGQMHDQLGLASAEDLQEKKTIQGLNGWTRIRMQQEYKGLRVVGASYILHEKDGKIKKSSGDLLPYIELNIKPGIKHKAASQAAEEYTNVRLLSKTNGAAVVLPDWDIEQAELVVMDLAYPNYSGNYTLAYHVIIANLEGRNQYRESIYINANTGDVIEAISEIAHTSVEGIAMTKYYGEQRIITDSLETNLFVLRDSTRGDGIITLNGSLEDFTDEDNFWNNFGNKEEVGTDAHYCASAYYDYMVDNFNWDGLDGEGRELRSRVYGDERNAVNATWNGSYSTFFSGDCDEYGPLTTLDVVGHEFAHGFTDFTSDLIYRNESGALNESISDILGKALEKAYDPDNFTWFLGATSVLTNDDSYFRDMSDPNAKSDPKLYTGVDWEFGAFDNGGVHTNSGVLNFWYYLLTEGKADVNELGVAYDVKPIGFQKATSIVFTMNVAYLTESSTYTKAVIASVEAVKDLYGENSPEMESVLEAWKAVGLYTNSGDYDVRIELVEDRPYVCVNELDSFLVDVIVINDGLNSYMPGDMMTFSYEIDGVFESEELMVLSEELLPSDTLFYTFDQSPTTLTPGSFFNLEVNLEAQAMADPNSSEGEIVITNNTDAGRITTTEIEGLDLNLTFVRLTNENACQLVLDNQENSTRVTISFRNSGCEVFPSGDIPFSIANGAFVYFDTMSLGFDLRASVNSAVTKVITMPEEIANGDDLVVRIHVGEDINSDNDEIETRYLFLETVTEGYVEDFNSLDLETTTEVFVDADFVGDAQIRELNGNSMLFISGTRDEPFGLENCGEQDLFFRENFQKTDIELCVNTVGVIDPVFSFDLIQYRADVAIENIDPSYASMVQVTIDGQSFPIIAGQPEGQSIKQEFPLPEDFSGDILIEAIALRGSGAGANLEEGDFVLIDNLSITSGSVSNDQTLTVDKISVYPNPSSSIFNFEQQFDSVYDLTIYDGLGRVIFQAKDVNANTMWDASQVEGGIYFYEIQTQQGNIQQGKLVVSE